LRLRGSDPVTAVYEPRVEEGYEWALLVDSGDYKTLRGLDARNPGDLWRPPWMFLLTADEDGRRRKKAEEEGGYAMARK
jgi:hypothetical protein